MRLNEKPVTIFRSSDFSVEKPVSFTDGPEVQEPIKRSTDVTEKSLSEQITAAIQNAAYDLADAMTTTVDEALEVVEDVLNAFEQTAVKVENIATPQYHINITGLGERTPAEVAEEVIATINKYPKEAMQPRRAPETGGSRVHKAEPLDREQLLREVYKYVAKHSHRYEGWGRAWEDYNATTTDVEPLDTLIEALRDTL